MQWFEASYSGSARECVEIAWLTAQHVGIRDSKNPDGPTLVFDTDEWNAFTISIRDSQFD
ncbi:hypothetical protein NRB20_65900 [Nocardia sp. RB20]|uniref:DUF397 domain-containing protein n=1 Tax=Nocardia macrotermitis TaxID=2585198 RepID=A0A7K0DCF8_9NOCA|nr:hypothetical protein [Nocardia macrotermitis]